MTTLAERLGYDSAARLVILNCDGLGMCHAVNDGVFDATRSGIATSASLMVPCPWAHLAVSQYLPSDDIGVHLTLTSELELYRWGPITQAPSLLGGGGGFPRTVADVWDHAELGEVHRELSAQIERAIEWGIDVTNLDSHMQALPFRPEFFDVYLELAIEFSLPIRLPSATKQADAGFPFRDRAEEEGILSPDFLQQHSGVGGRTALVAALNALEPGVTEIFLAPAADHPELWALDSNAESRVADLALLSDASDTKADFDRAGVHLIGWREVREAQRAM